MAIRFGSSDPKIWLHFCLHLTTMIIRYIQKHIHQHIFGHAMTVTAMHNYAFCVYLCSMIGIYTNRLSWLGHTSRCAEAMTAYLCIGLGLLVLSLDWDGICTFQVIPQAPRGLSSRSSVRRSTHSGRRPT